jgi:hypothetical protein
MAFFNTRLGAWISNARTFASDLLLLYGRTISNFWKMPVGGRSCPPLRPLLVAGVNGGQGGPPYCSLTEGFFRKISNIFSQG